jgi:hypothetical protein
VPSLAIARQLVIGGTFSNLAIDTSFAEVRQSAGVMHDEVDKMAKYAEDEVAGDAEITDIRREIRSVDDELDHARSLRARESRVLRSRRH